MNEILDYILSSLNNVDFANHGKLAGALAAIVIGAVMRYFEINHATGKKNLFGKIMGIFRSKKQNQQIKKL